MKMNLIVLSKNNRLSTQLLGYVEKENVDKCREFLLKYFPSNALPHVHDRLVIEMADLFASLYDEPNVTEALTDYSESVQSMISRYHRQKNAASEQLSKVYRQSKTNYVHMSKSQRAAIGYTPETVVILLKQLDAKERYEQFTDGYEFERYQLHEWLRYYINEALGGRTHTVTNKKKQPLTVETDETFEIPAIEPVEPTNPLADVKHPWDDKQSATN